MSWTWAYHEPEVEESYAKFECPEEACCCRPTRDLDLGPDDPGISVSPSIDLLHPLLVLAPAVACGKGQDVPHYVFWIIVGKCAPLRRGQAVVRKTVRSSP